MPRTKQPGSARGGYINQKHMAEGRKVKQMKKDARNKAVTVNRLQKGNFGEKMMSLAIALKDAGAMRRANEAERKYERMRRVRYGDNLTAQRVNRRDWKK